MKIVFISRWYSENMGYIENCLPEALARQGHEVHLITSTGQVYFNHTNYQTSYENFLGPAHRPVGKTHINGVTIHRLPFFTIKKQIILNGLFRTISTIKPDIVHAFEHADINILRICFLKVIQPFKLFTANHTSFLAYQVSKEENNTSGFKHTLIRLLLVTLPGIFISRFIRYCYCVTVDAGEIAQKIYGVQKHKIKITTLGVNTTLFKPDDIVKKTLRQKLGFTKDDIVCIYSGKLSNLKNPVVLAKAINKLNNSSLRVKGIFIGDGEQFDEISQIPNCIIIPFQKQIELAEYYKAADIAVWPFGESSSQLDAVASGLCLILSDSVQTYDFVSPQPTNFTEKETYRPKIVSRLCKTNNIDDLVEAIESLKEQSVRQELIDCGKNEVVNIFSWDAIAKRRLNDYINQ